LEGILLTLLKLRFGNRFSFATIYNSPFTASVYFFHLLQEEITTPSPLTGSGEAGFGKRSESLAKLEL